MEEKFSLEDALAEIRAIVDKMQQGVSDFDQQVALFEAGTKLIKDCRAYLNQSELQIQQLIDGEFQPLEGE
jgi:exodeoxyribonuclease VII small subunit